MLLLLDPDKLGLLAAAFFGWIALAIGFLLASRRGTGALRVAIYAGLTAIVSYCAVFWVTYYIAYHLAPEIEEARRQEQEAEEEEAGSEAEEAEGTSDEP